MLSNMETIPKSKAAGFEVLTAKNVFTLIYRTAVYGR